MLKAEAERLRLGLLIRVVDVSSAVSWADAAILAGKASAAPVLFDISLAAARPLSELISLLGEVPGECEASSVGRRVAAALHVQLLDGNLDVIEAARAIYRINLEGYAPDAHFADHGYTFDDSVDLALAGTYGTLDQVRADIIAFLSKYAGQDQPPPA